MYTLLLYIFKSTNNFIGKTFLSDPFDFLKIAKTVPLLLLLLLCACCLSFPLVYWHNLCVRSMWQMVCIMMLWSHGKMKSYRFTSGGKIVHKNWTEQLLIIFRLLFTVSPKTLDVLWISDLFYLPSNQLCVRSAASDGIAQMNPTKWIHRMKHIQNETACTLCAVLRNVKRRYIFHGNENFLI